MATRRKGQTLFFAGPPTILATAAVVGPREGAGPLAGWFDVVKPDRLLGQKSWELAESKMAEEAVDAALAKAGLRREEVDVLLAGDLLNQIIASSFVARSLDIPYLGLYGACSTMAEAVALGAVLVDGGYADRVCALSSSHHDTAERQYRYPVEFGSQRPPTAQWTATAAGAAVVGPPGGGRVGITHATLGRVVDWGRKDPFDMGSAMAPAAADTIAAHFRDTGRSPEDYDLVVTGDLAAVGHPLAHDILKERGLDLEGRFVDCGRMLYDETQDAHAGGSGCGCSAAVFCGYLMRNLVEGRFKRVLLVATGALHSPTSMKQGETIPCIAHAIAVEGGS
ncbi:MAG: stage V sporulation protein AD [Firmicutes bacterium]|nr:stage V sporulation protein AD [Bacillota bacterium]